MSGPVARFTALVERPEADLDLAEAALTLAQGADPGVDVVRWLGELDALAARIDDLDDLRRVLFAELRLRGDRTSYADPQNSLLHRVLSRRVGIPISLAVVAIEVGRRAGVPLEGIGMPGHFLVRAVGGGELLDPFHGGAEIDEAGAEALFRATTRSGAELAFGPHLLPVVGPRAILARMLANLRVHYRQAPSARDLEWVLQMRLALPGARASEAAELAGAMAAQGRVREGAAVLEDAAVRERRAGADPEDAGLLHAHARALRARLN